MMRRSHVICVVNSHVEHREVLQDDAFLSRFDGVVCQQVGWGRTAEQWFLSELPLGKP